MEFEARDLSCMAGAGLVRYIRRERDNMGQPLAMESAMNTYGSKTLRLSPAEQLSKHHSTLIAKKAKRRLEGNRAPQCSTGSPYVIEGTGGSVSSQNHKVVQINKPRKATRTTTYTKTH